MYCYQRNHHNFFMFIITIIIFIHLFIFYQNEKKTLPSVLFPSISKLSVQLWVILFPSQKMIINTVKLQLSFRLLLRREARNSRSLICDPESTVSVYKSTVHEATVHVSLHRFVLTCLTSCLAFVTWRNSLLSPPSYHISTKHSFKIISDSIVAKV